MHRSGVQYIQKIQIAERVDPKDFNLNELQNYKAHGGHIYRAAP